MSFKRGNFFSWLEEGSKGYYRSEANTMVRLPTLLPILETIALPY